MSEINKSENECLLAELNKLVGEKDLITPACSKKIKDKIYQGDTKLKIIQEICEKIKKEKTINE